MIKQALDYDKDGDFVRLWLPELRGVRGARVHTPWTLDTPPTYPRPLVTPPEWSRHAAGGGGGQRGVDFYFKPQGKQQNQQSNGRHQNNGQAKKQKKPALRGGRVQ